MQYALEPAYAVTALVGKDKLQDQKRKREQHDSKPEKKLRKNVNEDGLPPNSILFVQNIPKTLEKQVLINLFKQFPGFKEVRLIPSKQDIGIIFNSVC